MSIVKNQGGYSGRIVRIDLSSRRVSYQPTSDYADKFLGGRGIAARLYWDEVGPQVKAFDPANCLIFMTGPLSGFPGIGGPRWMVCGKSSLSSVDRFSYCNLGGRWGTELKFAGYDGIVVHGNSDVPVYILVQDEVVAIRDAKSLWGKSTVEVRQTLKREHGDLVKVVACGPAGENKVAFASLLADQDSSGSGGLGAVMGSKKLKAIVVRGTGRVSAANPDALRGLTRQVRTLRGEMGAEEFRYRVGIYDNMKLQVCFGCTGCLRRSYRAENGTTGKFFCASGLFYLSAAQKYYGVLNEAPFYATRLADAYGVDTSAIEALLTWLELCKQSGILTDEYTGIPLEHLGSIECIETLICKIAAREDFGDTLAQGLVRAADIVGQGSKELITDYASDQGTYWIYCPRLFITTGLLYAMEPRCPVGQVHEASTLIFPWLDWVNRLEGSFLSSKVFRDIAKRFWGSELAADFSTYDGKAMAARMVQDREYVKESLILCDYMWPMRFVKNSPDHVGDPSLESKLLSAATGSSIDETELYQVGERIFNLQRAILAREGRRGRDHDRLPDPFYRLPLEGGYSTYANPDCLVPGRDGALFSRKGAVVDRQEFERTKDEYYRIRGWDVATGLQTRDELLRIGLQDVIPGLESCCSVV